MDNQPQVPDLVLPASQVDKLTEELAASPSQKYQIIKRLLEDNWDKFAVHNSPKRRKVAQRFGFVSIKEDEPPATIPVEPASLGQPRTPSPSPTTDSDASEYYTPLSRTVSVGDEDTQQSVIDLTYDSDEQSEELDLRAAYFQATQEARGVSLATQYTQMGNEELRLHPENLNPQERDQLEYLTHLYRNPEKVWLLDTEFTTLTKESGFNSVAYEISICRINKERILAETIHYKIRTEKLLDFIEPHLATTPEGCVARRRYARGQMKKFYGRLHTAGKTPTQLRDVILEQGWSKDHTLLSWHSSVNNKVFQRLLNATDDDVRILTPHIEASNPINVHALLKKMLPRQIPANVIDNFSLGSLHRGLFPEKVQGFHRALWDAEAFADIVQEMVLS